MKKIFTLLLGIASISIASAQSHNQQRHENGNHRDIILGQSNVHKSNNASYGSYSFSSKEKDAQIKMIRKHFNQEIKSVKKQRHLRAAEKSRKVRQLELQRDAQIKKVQARFSSNKNRHHDNRSGRKW